MVLSHTGAEFDVSTTHASRLNKRSPLGPVDLIAWGSKSSLSAYATPLPSDVTAHRCGDYVFTYHGIDLEEASPKLWLVIQCFNAASNESCWPTGTVFVGYADGTVRDFPVEHLPSELESQNQVRARLGLTPLPDPCNVVEDSSP
jgi:hypothetical protein